MSVDLSDPWLVERSRALHADLERASEHERGDIMERHAVAAVAERPDFITGELPEATMVDCIYHAALYADDPDYGKKWMEWFHSIWPRRE